MTVRLMKRASSSPYDYTENTGYAFDGSYISTSLYGGFLYQLTMLFDESDNIDEVTQSYNDGTVAGYYTTGGNWITLSNTGTWKISDLNNFDYSQGLCFGTAVRITYTTSQPTSTPTPKIGSSDISKIYLGTQEVQKIYLGSELVYEAEITPPAPTVVFDLDSRMPSGYDADDVETFLSGQTTSLPLSLYSTSHGGSIGLTCSDWTKVREIRIDAPGTNWGATGFLGTYEDGFLQKDGTWNGNGLSKSYTDSTAGIAFAEIKDTVDRSTIDSLWITCNRSSATLTKFTVYDDDGNIIIPAS